MKKMIIYMSKLSVGGMEKALVDLLRLSDYSKNFDVTLYLAYSTCPEYENMIPRNVKVRILCRKKWNTVNKIITSLKLFCDLVKSKIMFNKYDVSICYSHHHGILSTLAHNTGKKSIIYVHTDLIKSRTTKQLNKLLNKIKLYRFDNIICVSERAKESLLSIYPNIQNKTFVINNYIDGEEIIKKGEMSINDYDFSETTFINIARHNDTYKKVSRIIMASKKMIDEGYKFTTLLIGDGVDHEYYRKLIEKNNLGSYVKLIGKKVNPFPYLKKSSAFVFSSEFEGYGIVLDEARVLNIPIITTDVADAKIIVNEGYGILCDNSQEGVYLGMKKFLDEGYIIKKKFNYKEFNNRITNLLNKVVEDVKKNE